MEDRYSARLVLQIRRDTAGGLPELRRRYGTEVGTAIRFRRLQPQPSTFSRRQFYRLSAGSCLIFADESASRRD